MLSTLSSTYLCMLQRYVLCDVYVYTRRPSKDNTRMKKRCEICGMAKAAREHLVVTGGHTFTHSAPSGLRRISLSRAAYLESDEHRDAYIPAASCLMAGHDDVPRCMGKLTPHHTSPRGISGGLRAAEQYPVITLCAGHNTWVQEGGREWATNHTFVRDGVEHPFLRRPSRERDDRAEW